MTYHASLRSAYRQGVTLSFQGHQYNATLIACTLYSCENRVSAMKAELFPHIKNQETFVISQLQAHLLY